MSLAFTAFFVNPRDGPPKHRECLEYIKFGAAALAATNPKARYVVLTDKETAPLLENEVEVFVCESSDAPLMVKYTSSQEAFERSAKCEMSVLAATDCIPVRNLNKAMAKDHGLALTYNKSEKINNVGYVRDHDLAAWFLHRVGDALSRYPTKLQEWYGEQRAWQFALGDWEKDLSSFGVMMARPLGRLVHIYMCGTHNAFPRKDGALKRSHESAFIIHCKGGRKAHMRQISDWAVGRAKNGTSSV